MLILHHEIVTAVKLTLEVWTYLRDHPYIEHKTDLPPELFSKIKDAKCYCPLCEIFPFLCRNEDQKYCPLGCCIAGNHGYMMWSQACDDFTRVDGADMIIKTLEKWLEDNEK